MFVNKSEIRFRRNKMAYLAYVIALIQMLGVDTSKMTFEQGFDKFLDLASRNNEVILWILVFFLIIAVLIGLVITVISGKGRRAIVGMIGCVPMLAFVIVPFWQWVMWRISIGMAESWTATGAADPVKFIVLTMLMIVLGAG